MVEDTLVLNPNFQKKLFNEIVSLYHGSINAAKVLKIPASSIRGYKNGYFKTVPISLINAISVLNLSSMSLLNENILSKINNKEASNNRLSLGRNVRLKQLESWKEEIPSIKNIFNGRVINFEKWFKSYKKLIDFGFRKMNYVISKDKYLEISYTMKIKNKEKNFIVRLPRKIKVNHDFTYFFGLWCGDRAGGKRFGICNQNGKLLSFTENFLRKNYQKTERILYISKLADEPKISYDKKFIIDKEIKGWVLSVHSNNGILASFFHYLQRELSFLLDKIDVSIFFAGLFDAEGNVSLYNRSFRWACQNKSLVSIYSKYLKNIGLFDRYDGSCLITYNKNVFFKVILPYMKHDSKINLTKFLCCGRGNLSKEYYGVLEIIKKYPNNHQLFLAKALKKGKIFSELKLLNDFGYVFFKGYPRKFCLTEKGLNTIGA